VLNTLTDNTGRTSSFDETVARDETVEAENEASTFSDPLVAERLRPPFWLTALAGFMARLLQDLRAACLAGVIPWLFAAAPCLPLSALVVVTHLSRRRFANFCRVVLAFLLIIGGNIAWAHFDLDTFFRPVAASVLALLPAGLTRDMPPQNSAPVLAAVNLLLGLVLYCHGFVGTIVSKRRNTMEGLS
jgi:hypothetical protein